MNLLTVKLSGLRELQQHFQDLPQELREQVLDPALKDGAEVLQQAAQSYIRPRTGRLSRSIIVEPLPGSPARQGWSVVARAKYSGWVEFGHNVRRGRGRQRPGARRRVPAHSYLRRARARQRARILTAITAGAQRRLASMQLGGSHANR